MSRLLSLAAHTGPRLVAEWVQHPRDQRAAQRLRAETFSQEYGIDFSHSAGLDCDHYDDFCRHLNVYDLAQGRRIVATTRVLCGTQAPAAGGFYSAQEFDVSCLRQLPGRVLEIGRTCVDPDYRSGAAILVLWSALAEYLVQENYRTLIGCASISLADGGGLLAGVMPTLRDQYFVPEPLRVHPSRSVILSAPAAGRVTLPPLLKAYLRMGARIGGEACWDPDFNCADVFILLDVQVLSDRYARRLLKTA